MLSQDSFSRTYVHLFLHSHTHMLGECNNCLDKRTVKLHPSKMGGWNSTFFFSFFRSQKELTDSERKFFNESFSEWCICICAMNCCLANGARRKWWRDSLTSTIQCNPIQCNAMSQFLLLRFHSHFWNSRDCCSITPICVCCYRWPAVFLAAFQGRTITFTINQRKWLFVCGSTESTRKKSGRPVR